MKYRGGAIAVGDSLEVEHFWPWLLEHINCIVRVLGPGCALFDHTDFHWQVLSESETTQLLQLVRGKELVGELLLPMELVNYVERSTEGAVDGEFIFNLISTEGSGNEIIAQFVMAHEFDGHDAPAQSRKTYLH